MQRKTSTILVVAIVIALIVGIVGGFFARAGEVSALRQDVAKVIERKGMLQEELNRAKSDLEKATKSEEPMGKTNPIAFAPEKDMMAHDLWLLIAPVGGGKYALSIRAEGLDHIGAEDVYLLEGITKTEPMQTIPLGSSMEASEFHAAKDGTATHWIILDKDPRTTFDKIVLLYLPGMQMERAVLTAVAKLSL